MGFFAEIASEARRGMSTSPQETAAPSAPAASEPKPDPPAAAPETPAAQSVPVSAALSAPAAAPVPETTPAPAESRREPPAIPEPPEQQPEPPAINLTSEADAEEESKRKQAHEAAEAKRKAQWDAKQAAKQAGQRERLARIARMSDEDVVAGAVKRISSDTEKLTRRNMKEAVCEYIQALCRKDAAFARRTMVPEKTMIRCFQYINRQAKKYAEQEMEDNGMERTGVYGLDVPDSLCYQWAVDYFDDENAEEDHKNDEKFVPKPYIPASTGRKKAKTKTAQKPSGTANPHTEKPKDTGMDQMTLGGMHNAG